MTPAEFGPLISRLVRWHRVRMDDGDTRDAHLAEFMRRLGRFDVRTVQRAVDKHIDSTDQQDRFYPTPGRLDYWCRVVQEDDESRRQPKRRGPEIRGGPLRPLPEIMRELRIVRDDDTNEGAA